MLIKSKTPEAVAAPEVSLSMEDIDHVISAYELHGVVATVEDLHDEINHANDLVESSEQLALVLESIQELSMSQAALIQVVGDVAGATCGVDGSVFTPSMEDVEEGVPMGQKIKAILNQIAAFIRKVFAQIKMYIAHQFSKSHRIAKMYETLGETIRGYNFNTTAEIEIRDVPGAKGGLMAVARELPYLIEQATRCADGASSVITAQFSLIQEVKTAGIGGYAKGHSQVLAATNHLAQGYTVVDSATSKMAVSKALLGGGHIEVMLASEHNGVASVESYKETFAASIGVNQNRVDQAQPGMTTIKITHQLAKDVFEALRPLVALLTHPNEGYLAKIKSVDDLCMSFDQELHRMISVPPEQQAHEEEVLKFFRVAASHITHGQLKDLIHSHHYFQRVLQVVMDYIDQCLKLGFPQPASRSDLTELPAGVPA